jgi:hypothetical protein
VGGKSKSIACKASGLIAEAAALALKFKVGKGSLDFLFLLYQDKRKKNVFKRRYFF